MNRVTLAEALRIYNKERGLDHVQAEREAQRVCTNVMELCKGSADIHLHDFYVVAVEDGGEFYLDTAQLEAALEHLRAMRGASHKNE